MIKNILVVDTETTGLFPDKGAKLIEVGALLFNVQDQVVVQTLSGFLPCEINEAEHINHIKAEWTRHCNPEWVLDALCEMAYDAEAIVAHNAPFDKGFLQQYIVELHDFWSLPWICTKSKFQWPVHLARNRLQDVCTAMGVQYKDAHRSLSDCQFLVDCFKLIPDLQARLARCL